MSKLIHKDEAYFIVGLCMEVHNTLGKGFSEAVYAEALEIELKQNGVPYKKEVKFKIKYKDTLLKKSYCADLVIDDKIILELKAVEAIHSNHVKQTLNYLAVSGLKLGLIINFGEDRLAYKRVVL
ncbi:GxxExxY protein [Winogradskyella wandonensis]|uniref:GxxExxY protein n=1 Tax=Winogradskyella wandonensis TaxID=1442586 RepID=A0A4R1KRX8_9FLAO|nr:GxxExxY protein [Winogradskyella wandonensis]TCK67340.1 GxxExxY protein [Winogradskyella wandonensis]